MVRAAVTKQFPTVTVSRSRREGDCRRAEPCFARTKKTDQRRAMQPERAPQTAATRNRTSERLGDGKPKCKDKIIRALLIWCQRQEAPNQRSISTASASKPKNQLQKPTVARCGLLNAVLGPNEYRSTRSALSRAWTFVGIWPQSAKPSLIDPKCSGPCFPIFQKARRWLSDSCVDGAVALNNSWPSQHCRLEHKRNMKGGWQSRRIQHQDCDLLEFFSLGAQVSLTILEAGYEAIQPHRTERYQHSAEHHLQQPVLQDTDGVDPRL